MVEEGKIRVSYVDRQSNVVVDIVDLNRIEDASTQYLVVPNILCNIGDTWDGEKFISGPVPVALIVPYEVTLAQFRIALLNAGLLDGVESFVKNSGNTAAKIAWEYTNIVSRAGALISALAPGLGMTGNQIDDLFIAAGKIRT
jgi:hypothetical protein